MKLHNIASRCLFLLTGMALFTACDNENDFAGPNNRDSKPLRIETSIAETRAVVTSTNFAEGDRVGLFVLDDGGQVYADNAMNQQATYNGAGWDMQSEITLSKEKTPYVFAVYPYYGSADYIPVDINMRYRINITPNSYEGIEGQPDWMYANALPLEGNTAKLTFLHALARVTLQLKSVDQQGDGFLSSVRMQNAMKYDANNAEQGRGTDLCTTGWMSLRNGSINTEETKNAESYIEQTTEMGLSAEAQTIDFLVIPTALPGQTNTPDANTTGGGIEVLLTIDGKQYRVDLGVPTWHAGQQYIYPITINRNSAEVTPELTPTEGEYVDLGLPSGTLWASCNVGANSPEEAGGYYAWGETDEKEDYSIETSLTYYKYESDLLSRGIIDENRQLTASYDVATVKLGKNWRMPTELESQELFEHCTWEWTTLNGVDGSMVIGPNGNAIFFPAVGYRYKTSSPQIGYLGCYWSATPRFDTYCESAFSFSISNTFPQAHGVYEQRCLGCPVRPIYDPQPTEEAGEAVDLGLSVKWASFNVGATKPEEYGGYYAWGETEEKEDYSWATYKWCNGTETSMTKYCTNSNYGIVDNKTILDSEDDVAHVKWGGTWRMPTDAEIEELLEKCTWTWTINNNIGGYVVTGINGNSIFLPAGGAYYGNEVKNSWTYCLTQEYASPRGDYLSANLFNSVYYSSYAYHLGFDDGSLSWNDDVLRWAGLSVRPVTE